MAEFLFSNEHRQADLEEAVGFLGEPRLWIPSRTDYPNYDRWLERVGRELGDGTKRVMLSRFGDEIVGAVVYQRDKDDPATLEIKNISIAPDARGRYCGSFLLRNAEIEGATQDFAGCERVTVDTKITNLEMLDFLLAHGYSVEEVVDLYGLDAGEDAVLTKPVGVTESG